MKRRRTVAARGAWRLGRRAARAAGVALGLLAAACASAGDVERAEVHHEAGRYTILLDVIVDAPFDAVLAIVGDDARLPEISPSITEARVLEVIDATHRRRSTIVATCVLFFCFEFAAEETVTVQGPGRIHTRVDPEHSDFRHGESQWLLEATADGRTRLSLESAREPRFWVPPGIGPWFIERRLERELREIMRRVERLAQGRPLED